MTKSSTTQKWVLGIIVGLIVLVVGAIVISNQVDESNLKDAEAKADAAEEARRWDNRMKESKVDLVRTTQGDVAASTLEACYASGYPTGGVTNGLDTYPPAGMSRRRVAECDRILQRQHQLEAQSDAEEKRKDAGYDRTHPIR